MGGYCMLSLKYDKNHDVLYISIDYPRPSYGDEILPGVVILYHMETDEVTGVTIFDFKKRLDDNSLWSLELPPEIDLLQANFSDIVSH